MNHVSTPFIRCIQAIAAVVCLTWFVAAASTIPAVVEGSRTYVSVEPLLQSLQLAYVIEGTHLQVAGRDYPKPLVERGTDDMADAYELAHFLHLSVVNKNGLLVFSSPDATTDDVASAPPPEADLETVRAELLAALNAHRKAAGLDPLEDDLLADQAAQFQALDMARSGVMRHEDAQGRSPLERFSAMGGHATWYAENVGWYGLDVSGDSALWNAVSKLDAEMMAEQPPDDGHRENILSTRYESVGIGLCVGPHGLYLAEDFAGR